jgi:Tol biopolymer transport system component
VHELATGNSRDVIKAPSGTERVYKGVVPRFSADGRKIAFVWNTFQQLQLRVIDIDGSHEQTLQTTTPEVDGIWPVAFTPDGKEILVRMRSRSLSAQIAFVPVVGGPARVLKTVSWQSLGEIDLSPDGRFIAYDARTKTESPNRTLFVLAADGSREIAVSNGSTTENLFGWMPDGKWLLSASNRSGKQELWAIPTIDGKAAGSPIVVRADIGEASPLGITRSGAIFYRRIQTYGHLFTGLVDWGTGKVSVSRAASNWIAEYGPDFSRDGTRLAYIAHRGTDLSDKFIVVRNLATGEEHPVTPRQPLEITVQGGYRWLLDGKSFMVPGHDAKHGQSIFLVDTDSGEVRFLFEKPGAQIQSAAWVSNGKSIFYMLWDQVRPRALAFVHDIESNSDRQLVTGFEDALGMNTAVSPDGKYVAFVPIASGPPIHDLALSVIPTGGGTVRTLLDEDRILPIDWSPDSRRILFSRSDGPGTLPSFWWISVEGGPKHKLDQAGRVHPDGRRIGWIERGNTIEVWTMENLLSTLSKPSR